MATSFHDRWEQVGDGHGFIAVWAEPARSDAAAEDAAVRAPLLAQVARFARRAFVDGGCPGDAVRDLRQQCRMAPAPDRLATSW